MICVQCGAEKSDTPNKDGIPAPLCRSCAQKNRRYKDILPRLLKQITMATEIVARIKIVTDRLTKTQHSEPFQITGPLNTLERDLATLVNTVQLDILEEHESNKRLAV